MLDIEVYDFTATTAPTTTAPQEPKMRKTANTLRTTGHHGRKAAAKQAQAGNTRMAAVNSRQYDFRRGGYRR